VRRALFFSLACALAIPITGCGPQSGVTEGATVAVYVAGEPLCEGARKELDRNNERAGGFRVRTVCLGSSETLAASGANARRAAEDSTTVGYVGEPSTILDAAGIAQVSAGSGSVAMARLLRAIRQAEAPSSLRDSVLEQIP